MPRQFISYLILSAVTTTFIYPIASHWVWSSDGFLYKDGFVDFAGSGVVHMLGACSGAGRLDAWNIAAAVK